MIKENSQSENMAKARAVFPVWDALYQDYGNYILCHCCSLLEET